MLSSQRTRWQDEPGAEDSALSVGEVQSVGACIGSAAGAVGAMKLVAKVAGPTVEELVAGALAHGPLHHQTLTE